LLYSPNKLKALQAIGALLEELFSMFEHSRLGNGYCDAIFLRVEMVLLIRG
jgi:hypothetical protein